MTDTTQEELPKCELCGKPMPPGEIMFKYHGYSGPCPKPPLPQKDDLLLRGQSIWQRLDPAIEDPVGTGLASKWIAEALSCTATLKAENERLHKLLDDAEAVLVRQRDARTAAQSQVETLKAEKQEAAADSIRLNWLHNNTLKDADGYEYGVARLKFDSQGRIESALWTSSDHSDIDALIKQQGIKLRRTKIDAGTNNEDQNSQVAAQSQAAAMAGLLEEARKYVGMWHDDPALNFLDRCDAALASWKGK